MRVTQTVRHKRSHRAGFSLMELMLAIAILGMGMAMIAAAFPAGMKNFQKSNDISMGTRLCNNGLSWAVFQRQFTQTNVTNKVFANTNKKFYAYSPDSNYGCMMIARQETDINNVFTGSYQIISVGYKKLNNETPDFVKATASAITPGTYTTSMKLSGITSIPKGSPVIFTKTGEFGIIEEIDIYTNVVKINGKISAGAGSDVLLVSSGGPLSPAMKVMATSTGLWE